MFLTPHTNKASPLPAATSDITNILSRDADLRCSASSSSPAPNVRCTNQQHKCRNGRAPMVRLTHLPTPTRNSKCAHTHPHTPYPQCALLPPAHLLLINSTHRSGVLRCSLFKRASCCHQESAASWGLDCDGGLPDKASGVLVSKHQLVTY